MLQRLRKITADLCGGREAQAVGKAGSQIGFMADHGNMTAFCRHDHRYGHETAFGKDDVRLQTLHQGGGL